MAWWKFPLQILSNVAYLQIYLRSTTVNRHVGFSVYVFNDSSFVPPSNGSDYQVFTQDTTTCPDRVMNITITKLTQGIALYISKEPPLNTACPGYTTFATLEVCEVQVFACDSKCANEQCDAFNGSCIYGCSNPHKKPPECYGCIHGFFGPDCDQKSGQCMNGTICDSTLGFCLEGCKPNWDGLRCDRCVEGFYGLGCSQACGNCRLGTYCNNIMGVCAEGCQDNWDGPKCDVCQNGFYGKDCASPCGKCQIRTFCNNHTGICPTSCQEKWHGSKCDECIPGLYGAYCVNTCGKCVSGIVCDPNSGLCPEGCQEQWNGPMCDVVKSQLYCQRSTDDEVSIIGLYITIAIVAISLVIAIGVILFLRRRLSIIRQTENTRNQKQSEPQNYNNLALAEERHIYTTIDSTEQGLDYQVINTL